MPQVGGDLGAMSALSSRFGRAGEAFQAQSQQITNRVADALSAFTEQMRGLDGEARVLAGEIDAEMKRLGAQAASTTWTGTNRQRQDQVVAALDDDIVAVRTAIESFVAEASSVVNGALTSTMTGMQDSVTAAGTSAGAAAEGFSGSVGAQRNAFDRAMNS